MAASILDLINGHDAIARSARLLLAVIAEESRLAARAPARLASLAATVAMHETQERCFIYAGNGAGPVDAASAAAEQARLSREWAEYLDAWPRQRIDQEMAGFRLESRAILSRLLARIDRENSYLYPHALAMNALTLI